VEKDNEDETLVKWEWLEARKTEAVEIIVDRVDLLEEVRKTDVRLANSKAGIKPTALLSALDKENSIEFPFDFLHYIYNYYRGYVSRMSRVTWSGVELLQS